ncbi:MAG: hypothetical protein QMB62_10090 [Oscillospiraceae bacterium]
MPNAKVETKEIQDKIRQEKVTPERQKEIDDKLKQLGITGPGYIRNMMDNDMKGVEITFLE